jgi:hypothetical protein
MIEALLDASKEAGLQVTATKTKKVNDKHV